MIREARIRLITLGRWLSLGLGVNSCALTTKADLVEIRYFNPERLDSATTSSAHPGTAQSGLPSAASLELRLGRISSGANLRERIAYRNSDFELGYHDDLRWTERPETYVRRQLSYALFEVHAIKRVLVGSAPTLDVEVIAFDELRLRKVHAARVQIRVILYDDQGVLLEKTITTDRSTPGTDSSVENVVAAMARALVDAAEQITVEVERALKERILNRAQQSGAAEQTQ
jgi:cholesterol transport system auxiliary component